MTFGAPEMRRRYHELKTALQHAVAQFEAELAKLGHELKCERVSDLEIILSIDKEPTAKLTDPANF